MQYKRDNSMQYKRDNGMQYKRDNSMQYKRGEKKKLNSEYNLEWGVSDIINGLNTNQYLYEEKGVN